MMNRGIIRVVVHPVIGGNRKIKRKSNRQKVWEYIRRNRTFRVGDVLTILEVSESSLQLLLRELQKAKYIKKVVSKKAFADKKYKLVRDTGVICPAKIKAENALWDANAGKKVFMGEKDE